MACRNLGEAERAAHLRQRLLVLGVLPGVHQHHGDRVDAVGARLFERRLDRTEIEQPFHAAVGADALVHLDDALIELFRQHDLLGEDIGTGLIGDAQRVAEAPGDEQQHAVALAFQQRIGRHGGAHPNLAEAPGRDRHAGAKAEQRADSVDGGIGIGFRILRKQLQRVEATVGRAPDDIGEGAAAVDPEVPFPVLHGVAPRLIARLVGRHAADLNGSRNREGCYRAKRNVTKPNITPRIFPATAPG